MTEAVTVTSCILFRGLVSDPQVLPHLLDLCLCLAKPVPPSDLTRGPISQENHPGPL